MQWVHQHTAPAGDETEKEFFDDLTDRVAAAAKQSLKELRPFDSIGVGQAKVERVASSRRVPTENGKVLVRYSSTKGQPDQRELPEGYIDPYLKTVTFASGTKPLVRMHYYATHPQSFYRDGRVSYDFVGMARERLQEEEGVPQIYFTGCAGDIAAGKYNDGSRLARAELADRLFLAMQASSAATRWLPMEKIVWRTVEFAAPLKESRRTAGNTDRTLEIKSLQIGRVHILNLAGESMVAYQRYAQDLMPEGFVAVAGYGEGAGYICTEKSYSEGGYEPRGTAFAPQVEAPFREAIRRLLGIE